MDEKPRVVFKIRAKNSTTKIGIYIAKQGFPERSNYFIDRLYDFGNYLNIFPEKYPICRFIKFAQRNLRCAIFEGTYIFIYKASGDELVIFDVIHGNRLQDQIVILILKERFLQQKVI